MLSDVISYLKKHKEASVYEISLSFKIEKSLAEAILEELIRKGKVEKHTYEYEKATCLVNCGGCTGNFCKQRCVYRLVEQK